MTVAVEMATAATAVISGFTRGTADQAAALMKPLNFADKQAVSEWPDLVPASTAVPAAAAQQENDDHYDEYGGEIHVSSFECRRSVPPN